ncbi:unnamed protein product, partial [Sphagnum compactum]
NLLNGIFQVCQNRRKRGVAKRNHTENQSSPHHQSTGLLFNSTFGLIQTVFLFATLGMHL